MASAAFKAPTQLPCPNALTTFTVVNSIHRSPDRTIRAVVYQTSKTQKIMKNQMRNFLLSGALMVAAFANAQDGHRAKERTPEQRAAQRTEWMTKELMLNADQSKKIEAIYLRHMGKMESIRAMEDKEQMKKAMAEVRLSQKTAVEAVLTPEQKDRLKELKAERQKKYQERKAAGKGKGEGKWKGMDGSTPEQELQEKR